MSLCYINGKFAPDTGCTLPISDLAIQRGVGVFDSIRIYNGSPFALPLHLERLAESALGAGIAADQIIIQLPSIIEEGLNHADCPSRDGIVKPYITGGDVNNSGKFPEPRFFVIFDDVHKPTTAEQINGIALEPNRLDRPYPLIKSTNYLYALIPLAKTDKVNFESLYITPQGEITEAMSSNFFLCKGGKILTAPVGRVLNGVTREILITIARENGFIIEERCPLESELAQADEAFISGSVKEVLSVVRVGKQIIGNGTPGPVAKHIHHLFLANIGRWLGV